MAELTYPQVQDYLTTLVPERPSELQTMEAYANEHRPAAKPSNAAAIRLTGCSSIRLSTSLNHQMDQPWRVAIYYTLESNLIAVRFTFPTRPWVGASQSTTQPFRPIHL